MSYRYLRGELKPTSSQVPEEDPAMLTKRLSPRQMPLSLSSKQKIILSLLAVALCTIPLWLGLQRAHSAPAGAVSPPLAMATPTPPLPPSVTLDVPDEVLIGDTFKFTVTFYPTNAVGYGPFIDLVLPAGGIDYNDSAGPCDGVTYVPGSAQMIGVNGGPIPLTTDVVSAPCNHTTAGACETLTHPYAANGISSVSLPNISVPEGAQLVTIKLPFGSFEPNQPPIVIQLTAKLSDHADVKAPLDIYARAGFQFGTTPNNDFNTDPPANRLSPGGVTNCAVWTAAAQVTPMLFTLRVEDRLSATPGPCYDGLDNGSNKLTDSKDPDCQHAKTYIGPEDETATGPNYPRQYKIILDIAAGQTVTNLTVKDCLPPNVVFTGIVPGQTVPTPNPVPPQAGALNNNCLSFTYPNPIVGTVATTDVVIVFEFYVPELDANGQPVLDPVTCVNATSPNDVKAEGDWTPIIDQRDPATTETSDTATVDHLLTDKRIAIQKSVETYPVPNAAVIPGSVLKYTLSYQVSDFFTVGGIVVTDTLADGQAMLMNPAPTLSVSDRRGPATIVPFSNGLSLFDSTNPLPNCGGVDGGRSLVFQVSTAMQSNSNLFTDPVLKLGILTGGHAFAPLTFTPATGEIVFYAQIQDTFDHPHPGDKFVDKDDPINNCVSISADIYTNHPTTPVPRVPQLRCADDSATALSIVTDTLKKSVYAIKRGSFVCGPGSINGACPLPPAAPEVRPGDQVTFRIQKTIPSGDAEQLDIEDWLPLPIFDIAGGSFTGLPCGALAPNIGCLGPADQMQTLTPPVTPSFFATPATNSIKFDYKPNFNYPANQPRTIDLLFTSTVTNQPFADGLFLTNEARECEDNTFGGGLFCQAAIAQVNLREPKLRIRKGVIATTNPNGQFSQPTSPPSTTALAPPNATLSLAGIFGAAPMLSSNDLATGVLDSNLPAGVDANDIVTFAITIENVGGAPAFDVKIEDIIPHDINGNPTCFTIVPNTMKVKRGTGATVLPFLYNLVPTTTGFTITSVSSPFASIAAYHPTNGANIIVITFQAKLLANIMPGCCDNKAEIKHYASELNGPDFVSAGFTPPFEDSAQVCVKPTLTKSLVATSEAHTSGTNVTIGEIVRYNLAIQLPETGLLPVFKVTDALPAGMKFLNGTARIAFVSNWPGISHPSFGPPFGPPFNVVGNQGTLPGLTLSASQTIPANFITVGPSCGDDPTFNLGNIKNNNNDPDLEYIVIEFNALVCNVMGNQYQYPTPLPNTFSVSSNGNLIDISNSLNLLVVEPNLVINKVASPATVAQGGTVTYTVTITNIGTADAFDVNFTDTLPSGLTFVPFSLNGTGSCLPFWGMSVSAPWVMCAKVPANGVLTITYKAVANPPLPCSTCLTTLTNHAKVTWTSLPGIGTPVGINNTTGSITPGLSGLVDGERNGSTAPPSLNDYAPTASALLTVTGPPCAQAPQGMVAWWPLDETAGTMVTDIAGNIPSNPGTTMPGAINLSGPNSLPGEVNNGFLFCGQPASRFVTVADQMALNFGTAQNFSIDAWIKTSSTSQFQMIVDKLNWPNPNAGYRFYVDNTNRLKFDIGPGAAFTSANPVVLTPGTWYHVAVTVDRSNPFVTFYINGTPDQAAGTATNNFNASSPGLNLLLGGTHETPLVPLEGCNYMLDEVEIFKSALSQSEIDSIYHAGCTGKCKCSLATNEKVACDPNGTFKYTFTFTNLSNAAVSNLVFSPANSNVTITPASTTIPPLAPGASTNVTVTIGGTGGVSGAKVCFSVGLGGPAGTPVSCKTEHCITLPTCQSSSCAKPPPGMVAWWRLDETNGATVVNDAAGFNNQGVPKPGGQVNMSGPSSVTGEVLGALFFAGTYVEVPPQAELDFGPGDFSIDAWVRPVDCSHGGGGVLSPIVDKFNGSTGFLFYLDQPTVGVANLYLNINGSTFVSSGTIPTLGSATWSHVAVTVAHPLIGPAVGVFYVNGFPVGTFSPPPGSVTNTLPMWIGRTRIPGGICETAIDELELFNRALLPAEIKSIADAKSAGKCSATGSLTVNKIVTNLWATPFPAGTNFPVTVSCLPSGPNVTLNLAAGGTQTLNNIPVGSTCTVTEGALSPPIPHPACASLGWGTPTYAPGQTVTIPSAGGSQTVTVTNQYSCKSASTCASLPANMISWWPLNEQAGATVVTDIKGGHNGTPSSGSFPATNFGPPGKVGGKLFVGARDNVSVPNDASLQFGTGNFSVDAWFAIAELRFFGGIVDKLDIAAKKGYALYVQDDHLKFVFGNGTSFTTYTSTAQVGILTTGFIWHHVGVTVDRSGGPSTFYLDGKLAGTFTALPSAINIETTSALLIGGSRLATQYICACEYLLDEVEIFNDVLSASDIKAIYDAGSAGKCTAGVHGKKFNDLNQNKVLDAGEPGLSGWTIQVTDQGGNTQTTTTDAQGNYTFSVPAPGTYTVSEVNQEGWFPTTSTRTTITVAANESADVNFGNIKVRPGGLTLLRGMNEFCIWGGGGPFNSPTQIDNPNSGVQIRNTGGVRFGAFGLCYGRILWANDKFAFKYAFNAVPVAVLSYREVNPQLLDPGFPVAVQGTRRNVYGAGLSPLGFQLYFRPQSRIKPFVNTSGGFLFFNDPVPQLNGARFNFTYDFGGGVQVFRDSRRAFNFGYKYQRLSNGGRALNYPGFKAHIFYFGYSIFQRPKNHAEP